ncbi:MAG: OmpA/MotB [Candidatus Midichloriaceae bacterium]|jgi:OOP family OmpA-OmpF porin|nr:OmpA/MotB [Candidatus Midichloriaceae bacterium]
MNSIHVLQFWENKIMSNKFLKLICMSALVVGYAASALANYYEEPKQHTHKAKHKHHVANSVTEHHEHHKHHHHHHHHMHKDVVVSSNGTVVRDSFGGCVRTKFNVATEKCGHHHKGDIMHMDERIIYFDFDQSALKDTEKSKLDVLAMAIKENNIHAVKVVGYTDKIGHEGYNHRLSHQRAEKVRQYLGSKVKLQSNVVSLRGLGEANQVKSCEGVHGRNELIDCLAPNRRVEVEVDYTVHKK